MFLSLAPHQSFGCGLVLLPPLCLAFTMAWGPQGPLLPVSLDLPSDPESGKESPSHPAARAELSKEVQLVLPSVLANSSVGPVWFVL